MAFKPKTPLGRRLWAAKERMREQEKRFEELADRWEHDTSHLSNHTIRAKHSAYREIVAMGPGIVHLILARMRNRPGHWFMALHKLTGENPIPDEDRGNVLKMTEHWMKWGVDNGHIEPA